MEIDAVHLKRLGFRPKRKSKDEYEVSVEIARFNYITLSVVLEKNTVTLSGLEVEGQEADQVRKEMFRTFSFEEIQAFLNKY